MKILFLLLASLGFLSSNATNYYFSSTSGDDNRSSAEAQNPNTPWRSINKLNSFFSSLRPGDIVSLKRGDTFYGSIRAVSSGTSTQPITITAYGSGARPVISGLTTLSNWVSVGNGVWESYNPALGSSVNTVLLNNVAQQMGRYPNSDAPNKGYLVYESHTGLSITDNELSSAINWTGADVVIRKLYWIIDRNKITSHSGNTLTFISGSTYGPWEDHSGFFIQNDIRTLDKQGEWFYNPSNKKMYVYFGSNAPSNYTVEASVLENLATGSYSVSNVVFDNLAFKGSNVSAVSLYGNNNITIKHCDFLFSGKDAIKCLATANFKLENSYITNSNNNGVSLEYDNNNAVIRNNKIENTHMVAGMGNSGDGNGIGLYIVGTGNLVEHNEILNTGYSGILFTGNYTTVRNNFINNFCLVKDDGGGIYTNAEPYEGSFTGRKITGNVIMNGRGTPEGLPNGSQAHGMYLDGVTTGMEVSGNTVANNTGVGIFSPNPNGVVYDNNTIYNNREQLIINHSISSHATSNNTVTNNILFSKKPTQMSMVLNTIGNDINNFGGFDNNYYARPFDDKMTIHNQYVNGTGTVGEAYDLETWKAKYGKDAASKRSPVQFPMFIVNSLLSGNKFNNGAFNTNAAGVGGWSGLNNMVIGHANGVLDGGSVQISFNAASGTPGSSLITMNVGALNSSKKYLLKFSLKGSNDNFSLGAFLRKNGGSYNPVTALQYSKISSSRTENELVFAVTETVGDADLVFTIDNQNIQFWLDNVQLYEADVTFTNPDDYIRFEYNATNANKSVSLDNSYIDVRNNVYTSTLTLPPYSSAVLMKTGPGAIDSDNTPPTIIPRNITINASNGPVTIQPSDVIQSLTDNSAVDNATIRLSQTQFNCSSGGGASGHQPYIATTTSGTQSFGGELGMEFKVNNPSGIVVSQLGAFDHQGNGITGTQSGGIRVAIFNKATRTIVPGLDAIIIGNADAYSGNHRMKNVPAVTLMPGDYMVVAKGYHSGELNGNSGGGTPFAAGDLGNGAISYATTCAYSFSSGSTMEYPTNQDGGPGNRYLAGTFKFSTGNTGGGGGNQTYSVTITATDVYGNTGQATALVTVQCDQSLSGRAQTSSALAETEAESSVVDTKRKGLSLFPNPTRGKFTLQLSDLKAERVSVEILNQGGAIVIKRTAPVGAMNPLRMEFDLTSQPAGTYFIRILGVNGIPMGKVVVIR